MSSTRLAAIPPAFGVRTLPAQATEYTFAYIQVPEDVSISLTLLRGGGVPGMLPFITGERSGLVALATGAAKLKTAAALRVSQ